MAGGKQEANARRVAQTPSPFDFELDLDSFFNNRCGFELA
jgi:hypothetical protein